jgi:hypothetical protein
MQVDFSPVVPVLPIIVLSVIAAVAAVWGAWAVFRSRRHPVRTLGLLAFRFAALAVFVSAVAVPHIVRDKTIRTGESVVVLVDVSDSMTLNRPDGKPRGTTAEEICGGVIRALEKLGVNTRVYSFTNRLYPIGRRGSLFDGVPGNDRSVSDLTAALNEIVGREKPAAAVVISDGGWPAIPAPSLPVFVFPAAVEPAPGFYPVSATIPRYALPETRFPLEIVFTGSGAEPFNFSVYESGEKVTGGSVSPVGRTAKSIVFLTAESEGAHFYEIVTERKYGSFWVWTEVLAGPLNVYFRSMRADYDSAFLKRAIGANRAVECDFRQDLIGGKSVDLGPGFGLTGADVIVLVNPRAEFINGDFAAELERRVADGAGLLIFYSVYPPDLSVLSAGPVSALSPVRSPGAAVLLRGGKPGRIAAGTYPVFGSAAVPVFKYFMDIGDPKPGAVTFWTAGGGSSVLTWMPYGRGNVMLLSGGGLAGWELSRQKDEPGLESLAGDLLLFLYGGDKGFTLSARVLEPGDRFETYVLSSEEPTIVIGRPAGETERLSPYEQMPAVWAAEWEAETDGRYTITARRFEKGVLIVKGNDFLVVERTSEKRAVLPGIGNLVHLADSSGGGYYPKGPDESFINELSDVLLASAPGEVVKDKTPIIPFWIGFVLFVGLLAFEWVLRRFSGLA